MSRLVSRLGGCALAVLVGGLGAALLLALAGGRPALAAPQVIFVNPGESIQAAIDGAAPGETIVVNAGHYTESLTLSKQVSLTGVSSATVIIHALAIHRVLTATGALVDSSVVISGLSLTGGNETGFLGVGGGVLVAFGAQPRLENLRIYGNAAALLGGGIYGNMLPLVLKNVLVQSNTVQVAGGGIATGGSLNTTGGLIANNTCTTDGCNGAGAWTDSASVTGTQFISNSSHASGGGLFAAAGITLTGASFVRNSCTQAGCLGAGLFTSSTLAANNTQFYTNTSNGSGGGAYAVGHVTLNAGRFEANTGGLASNGFGGGLYVKGSLKLTATAFISNLAAAYAGGAGVEGTAVLSGGLFQGNECETGGCSGGGLMIYYTTTLTATQFVSNSSMGHGGGLAVSLGAVSTRLGLFRGNFAGGIGGGLYAFGGGQYFPTLVMSGTDFINNHADSGAGAVYAYNTATIGGGLFQENTSPNGAGGIYTNEVVELTNAHLISNTGGNAGAVNSFVIRVYGGLFAGNRCLSADCTGGAARAYGVYIGDAQFISNTAWLYAGAVSGAYVTAVNAMFERNACLGDGCFGGALAAFINLTLNNSQFISNTARLGGGAAFVREKTSITGGLFQQNTCTQAGCTGGGLHAQDDLVLNQTQVIENSSRGPGGGVYISGTAVFTASAYLTGDHFAGNACLDDGCDGGGLFANSSLDLQQSAFVGNQARRYGGALYHHDFSGKAVNSLFARNSAGAGGAALYLASSGVVDVLYNTVASPTVNSGVAIDIINGTVQIIDNVVTHYSVGIRRIGGGSVYEDYNLFFGVAGQKVGTFAVGSGANDLSGDPRFENPSSDDYHLRNGSAAINNGVGFAVNTDFDGDTRPQGGGFDRGYDEYINLAPVAAGNSYSTPANAPLVVAAPGVLANDSDPNSEPLTTALVSGPASGSLSLSPNGGFVYTPNVAFTGPVTFTYRASDGELVSPTATVTITVTAPVAHKVYLPVVLR